MRDDVLTGIMKPARYIGGEWNVPLIDFDASRVRVALCFPDLYEIGMSNLGIRILYGILNNLPQTACERVFSYAGDMEEALRSRQMEAVSLESGRRIREFDIIGFSLGSELGYTNVLKMLSLGGIPLRSAERTHEHPLVIGGGPCVMNPEPLHDFFDLFIIGEAEEAFVELVNLYNAHKDDYKRDALSREGLLALCAVIEGVYVPSLYRVSYTESGALAEFRPLRDGIPAVIRKRFVRDFAASFYPTDWLVPYIQIVHDRITLEVMRGCPGKCRFCQARSQYAPLRIRGVEETVRLAEEVWRKTGYEEIAVGGLSVSDYPFLEPLLKELVRMFKSRAVGVSLPSVKAKSMLGELFSLIAGIKKTGMTFAPEAGSQALRERLAKDFDEASFFSVLERAYAAGYQRVKLYFMIGLPRECDADLDGIIDFAERVSNLRRKISKGAAGVNLSVNAFIPKPHTPFQWCAMDQIERIEEKQRRLRSKIRSKRVGISFHNRHMAFIEGVLSRGDRRMSKAIMRAYELGASFDAWADHFVFERWMQAFQETGCDPAQYLKERPVNEALPWDFLDVCVDKETLREEYNKSVA